ncbi:metal-dependent hydrolase [Oceanimonas sp. CHS3-5]|uniref:metal-dependent hydrolase n=1 Tax=Oceanimonas sp. CHS3-5 TaxID=3068186 RepID=UPI00273D1E59|nr:metal-dependent hydrolase [Oceanimonas sp. CHS3-5]MDP5291347.1 metal-dependent hydrolase [Oceanimonas sp. CHS3-5]
MDSVSQMALGAVVGVAVMGRHAGIGKAALAGALFGTLPDLDVVIDYGDPVSNMTKHRGASHALFYLTLCAPVLGWLLGRRAQWRRWTLTIWLIFMTHVGIDVMTVYGTQLGQPFTYYPFGVGSVFIIDPLYTLPLLAGLWFALRRQSLKANRLGLWLSTLYLGWSLVAQWQVEIRAEQLLARQGIAAERVLVTPAPLNTLLWRVLAMTPDGYAEGHISLLDREPTPFVMHDGGQQLYREWQEQPHVARMAWFTKGFFSMSERGSELVITDLRMGQEPGYVFNFVVAERQADGAWQPLAMPRQFSERPGAAAVDWLWRRALGQPLMPPG